MSEKNFISFGIKNNTELKFKEVELIFENDMNLENIFARKNNKTLKATLLNLKYKNLEDEISRSYLKYYNWNLGEFLFCLKNRGDNFYKKFLNKYGDKKYCKFSFQSAYYFDKRGLYAFYIGEQLIYIGRCLNSYKKRINDGYGNISPKNCYKDGQLTNCRINSLINKNKNVRLYLCLMDNKDEIKRLEKELIKVYEPEWNDRK